MLPAGCGGAGRLPGGPAARVPRGAVLLRYDVPSTWPSYVEGRRNAAAPSESSWAGGRRAVLGPVSRVC